MAQDTKAKRFKYGDTMFPIHYEGSRMRVYTNHCGELFVEDTRSGATMRISPYHYGNGGLEFTTAGRVEPIQVNGMIGWRVSHS